MRNYSRVVRVHAVALLLPVALAAVAYLLWPGLDGSFMMDDLVHLPRLKEAGGVDSLENALRFIFLGSSATGRPISFASFLINDVAWPSTPWPFKYTNLMIHLLNGVLVFVLSRALAGILRGREAPQAEVRRNWVALLAMVLWTLHPMNLSPVFLVIQRMTLLMGTFSLIGLIVYLRGRRQVRAEPVRGYVYMSIGVGLFAVLGVLAKEPGIMLVCYVLALESTLLRASLPTPPGRWGLWRLVFVGLPLLAVAAYFLVISTRIDELYLQRDFDMPERVMTEFRVLMEYLYNIVVPSLSNTGPYRDDYLVSRGLFEPATTVVSMLAVLGLVITAWWRRRANPLLSFAILWFFLAHVLESTILPIELYFEHRNYLPMFGLIFAASYWVLARAPDRVRPAVLVGVALFVAFEGAIAHVSSVVWGNDAKQAAIWAHEHPNSSRTRFGVVTFWALHRDFDKVARLIEEYRRERPDDASMIGFRLIAESCYPEAAGIIQGSMQELDRVVPTARFEFASIEVIGTLVRNLGKKKCTHTPEQVLHLIDLYLSNDKFARHKLARSILFHHKSKVYRTMRNLNGTIEALDEAYEASGQYDYRIEQALMLATAGLYDEALEFVEKARHAKRRSLLEWAWRDPEIERTEKAVHYFKRHAQQEADGLETKPDVVRPSNSESSE